MSKAESRLLCSDTAMVPGERKASRTWLRDRNELGQHPTVPSCRYQGCFSTCILSVGSQLLGTLRGAPPWFSERGSIAPINCAVLVCHLSHHLKCLVRPWIPFSQPMCLAPAVSSWLLTAKWESSIAFPSRTWDSNGIIPAFHKGSNIPVNLIAVATVLNIMFLFGLLSEGLVLSSTACPKFSSCCWSVCLLDNWKC